MRFLIVLLACSNLIAQPDSPPDARSLLMRSGETLLMSDSARLEGTETGEIVFPNGPVTTTSTFLMQRASGGRIRLEVTSGSPQMLEIADGKNVWTYFPQSHAYTQGLEPKGPINDQFGRLKFSRDPAAFRDARIEREESLPFGGQQVNCYVIHAAYNAMPGNPTATEVTRTVWIAKDTAQILRDTWDFTASLTTPFTRPHVRLTTDYSVIEPGISLAGDLFTFTPPSGSRELKTLTESATPKLAVRPALIHEVKPAYSDEARAAGLQGTVSLYVEVRNDGHPGKVQVMQGLGLGLDEAAANAVRQWQYKQLTGAADDVQSIIDVDVRFRLDPPAPWSVAGEAYSVQMPDKKAHKEVLKPVPIRYVGPDASACQASGTAVVEVRVDKDGNPQDVKALHRTGDQLADAAVAAVKGWQFRPAVVDGAPAEAVGEMEFQCRGDEPPATPPVFRVGGGVIPPVLVSKVEPVYSEEARLAKLQGSTRLYVHISPEGKPTNIQVVTPLGFGLDEKAMEAIKRWRFKPGMKGGQPVTVEANIDVNFRLL